MYSFHGTSVEAMLDFNAKRLGTTLVDTHVRMKNTADLAAQAYRKWEGGLEGGREL